MTAAPLPEPTIRKSTGTSHRIEFCTPMVTFQVAQLVEVVNEVKSRSCPLSFPPAPGVAQLLTLS